MHPRPIDRWACISRCVVVCAAMSALCSCRALPSVATPAATAVALASFVCGADERPMLRETLYFGRNRPGGSTVSDTEWRAFVDDAIVSRFPDGFTVVDAEGHWRSGDGAIEREVSQVVIVLHADDAASDAAVGAIVADYKRQFAQEAVLRERSPSCAKF
jgi:Protein of unknown function (DUF3574)